MDEPGDGILGAPEINCKSYGPIHLPGEGLEVSLDSQRLKDSKKVKNH